MYTPPQTPHLRRPWAESRRPCASLCRSRTTRNLVPSLVSMRIHVLLLSLMPGLQHRVATALRPCRILRPAHRSSATATTTEVETETHLPFKMEDIVNLCKRRGFVFQSSEIYSPMPGFFDFGPLGVELKNNVTENIIQLEFMLAILFRLRSYGGGTLCRSEMMWSAWTVRSLRLHSYGRPQDMWPASPTPWSTARRAS